MSKSGGKKRAKVALVSSGLGHTLRGFETSTARWFKALKRYSQLDVRLYCGGAYEGGQALWNFPRQGCFLRPVRYVPFVSEQQRWEFTYGVEQFSFWSALNFQLLAWKPDVVWVKDVPLAHLLAISRLAFGLSYKIIFANGSKFKPSTYKDFDLIQQIQESCYEEALSHHIAPEKMVLLSNCFPEADSENYRDGNGAGSLPATVDYRRQMRRQMRRQLGIGPDDWVVVSVAAWNRYHKRIDYLIEEVVALNDPAVHLILCGYPEVDTAELKALGQRLLGDRLHWLTVPEPAVPSVLHAADTFVLASLQEGLGNAIIEAALCGLPIITHPHEGARYSLADPFWYADLSAPGNLTERLAQMRRQPVSNERLLQLQSDVRRRFSPRLQVQEFEKMIERTLADGPLAAAAARNLVRR